MEPNIEPASHRPAIIRLAIGAVQGLALYLLYHAGDTRVWPATNPYLFLPMGMVLVFVPLLISQGLSVMRLKTLLIWAASAAVMLAIFGVYNRYRVWLPDIVESNAKTGILNANAPNGGVLIFAAAALFIAHALVAAGDAERKWIAPYARYFEAAWKQGVQLALSVGFTGAFWLVLFLGASLFKLIGLTFLQELIEEVWFAIPATTLAFAMAVHIADVRGNIVEGIRSIALALLSWLLPLMALLAAGFLIALIFTGLDPLWKTRNAASILLLTSAALVILTNAAFQDGDAARAVPKPMKLAGYVVGFILLPFVVIAGYAISLRVAQYGWTGDRITAAAVTVVALCYAGGYLAADIFALRKTDWRLIVERTNIASAVLSVAVIIALFSPIADPQRIAVNSQVARLESGAVTPEKFDFRWLRLTGGRFGHDALSRLAASRNAAIALKAGPVLHAKMDSFAGMFGPAISILTDQVTPQEIASQLKFYPAGRQLPQTFLTQAWVADGIHPLPPCLMRVGESCEVFPVELTGDTSDELVFVWKGDLTWRGSVMGLKDGQWSVTATLSGSDGPICYAAVEALRAGQYHPVAPTASPFMSIDAAASRLDVWPITKTLACPAK